MTQAKLRLAMALLGQLETKIGPLCEELGISKQTLYRHVSSKGELREDGRKLLSLSGLLPEIISIGLDLPPTNIEVVKQNDTHQLSYIF